MITGLDHVHIICGNMEETERYFKEVFDGQVVSRGESRGLPMTRLEVKGVIVALLGTEPGADQLNPGKGSRGLDHFGFIVKSLEPTVLPSGIKIAFIEGPDGIRIELVERN